MTDGLSLSKLFVLGLLAQEERHGYELVTIAERWAIHRWAGISIGSIYSTLRRFCAEKEIEAIRTEQVSNRPSRMVYRLTKTGVETCRKMIEEGLGSLQFESRELDLALAFAHLVPPAIRVQRLRDRLDLLVERRQQLAWLEESYASSLNSQDPSLDEFRKLRTTDPWIYAGIRHGHARMKVEEAWTLELINEIDTWNYDPISALYETTTP